MTNLSNYIEAVDFYQTLAFEIKDIDPEFITFLKRIYFFPFELIEYPLFIEGPCTMNFTSDFNYYLTTSNPSWGTFT